jgi:hypothetical protein
MRAGRVASSSPIARIVRRGDKQIKQLPVAQSGTEI